MQALEYDDGPLVWIDCEMTGLNALEDKIIEIAVIITNGHLEPVDEGIEFIIKTDKCILDNMNEWCINQHGKTGLTQACIDSPHTHEEVEESVRAYLEKWIPETGAGLLAGSSVHADMRFLMLHMPSVMKRLSYRILDVSTVKSKDGIPPSMSFIGMNAPENQRTAGLTSSALDDIKASINELKYYRDNVFPPIEPHREKSKKSETEAEGVRKTAI